jgi:uncharacterized protein HemX
MKKFITTAALTTAVLAGGALVAAPAQAGAATTHESLAQVQDETERQRLADEQRLRDAMNADFTRISDALGQALSKTVQSSAQQIRR